MELTNYHVESPSKVRLFFKDGRQQLVARTEIGQYLAPADAQRVQNAFLLRKAYFKELPKWVKIAAITVLTASLGYQGAKAAPSIQRMLHTIIPAIPEPAPTVNQVPEAVPAPAAKPTAAFIDAPQQVSTPASGTASEQLPDAAEKPDGIKSGEHNVVARVKKKLVLPRNPNADAGFRAIFDEPERLLRSLLPR